jgi:glycosyltransferase involved in cell wall biosynthesis
MRFCTTATWATLPHARVLADALREDQPDVALSVLLLAPGGPSDEPFELLRVDDFEAAGAERLLAEHRWHDLSLLMLPHVLTRLLAEGSGRAVYLAAEVDVIAPLSPVADALDRGGVALCPRVANGMPPDGLRPDPDQLERAGRISPALVAVEESGVASRFLHWWSDRLATIASAPSPAGEPPDAIHARRELTRTLDLAPATFEEIQLVTDPGCAVSYWNLHERRLWGEAQSPMVDDGRLRFMHFEGFVPTQPSWLSTRGDRVRVPDEPLLGELCDSYARRLAEAGWTDLRRRDDVGALLPNGMSFDDRLSHLHAEALTAGAELGDVFEPEGAERFVDWLREPAPHGAAHGINRYTYRVYQERPDLPEAYPDIDGADGPGFAGWTVVFGPPELGLPDDLLPPPPPHVHAHVREAPPEVSVNVTGFFGRTLGLGEAARGYVSALQAAGVPVTTTTVDVVLPADVKAPSVRDAYGRLDFTDLAHAEEAAFNLVCVNADELPAFARELGEDFFRARPSIGVWAWETDHIPERWEQSYGYLDEIWVYSTYVARNIAPAAPVPVLPIPPPVVAPDPQGVEVDLGVPEGFRFLFMFDFFSTIQRKNPVGLVSAFRRAFDPGEGPQLVIKTINGRYRPQALDELRWAARGRPDISVIDRSLSPRERDALLVGCDCYASLHRSEGLGLTLAECMALGRPVIGTSYSATTDFMTDENSYLVDYELTRVGADTEIYPPNGSWADPSVEHAAELMRRVVERPDEARAKGERAKRDVEERYAPAAVGALARARLERLAAASRPEAPVPATPNGGRPAGLGRRIARRAARALRG